MIVISKKVGKYEIIMTREDDLAPVIVHYSCDGTRLETYEHDSIDAARLTYNTIGSVIKEVLLCEHIRL